MYENAEQAAPEAGGDAEPAAAEEEDDAIDAEFEVKND